MHPTGVAVPLTCLGHRFLPQGWRAGMSALTVAAGWWLALAAAAAGAAAPEADGTAASAPPGAEAAASESALSSAGQRIYERTRPRLLYS